MSKVQNGDCKAWKTELIHNGESFQEIDMPHDVYHMIGQGSVLKYEKGKYSIVDGESIFDLHKDLEMDSQYCMDENIYYTPKGKLTKKQLEFLNQTGEAKEKNIFERIFDKFRELKEKFLSLFK